MILKTKFSRKLKNVRRCFQKPLQSKPKNQQIQKLSNTCNKSVSKTFRKLRWVDVQCQDLASTHRAKDYWKSKVKQFHIKKYLKFNSSQFQTWFKNTWKLIKQVRSNHNSQKWKLKIMRCLNLLKILSRMNFWGLCCKLNFLRLNLFRVQNNWQNFWLTWQDTTANNF